MCWGLTCMVCDPLTLGGAEHICVWICAFICVRVVKF